nr:single-stranded DNA-binding protein [Neobacillus sp. Marseille-Q6967]
MINQVTLVGRLTKDPELKVTPEGGHVTNVTLAVSRHFRNQNGEIDADFVQCTLWNKAADNTVQYCRKGSVVGITGRLQTRNYDNREGKRVFVTEVVAESIRFLSSKPATSQNQNQNQNRYQNQNQNQTQPQAPTQTQTQPQTYTQLETQNQSPPSPPPVPEREELPF